MSFPLESAAIASAVAELRPRTQALIDGRFVDARSGATFASENPATGAPYFQLPALGWGNGWATGNVLRFNTIGAQFPVWVVRTVQQGPESVPDDQFTLLIRGDVDTP